MKNVIIKTILFILFAAFLSGCDEGSLLEISQGRGIETGITVTGEFAYILTKASETATYPDGTFFIGCSLIYKGILLNTSSVIKSMTVTLPDDSVSVIDHDKLFVDNNQNGYILYGLNSTYRIWGIRDTTKNTVNQPLTGDYVFTVVLTNDEVLTGTAYFAFESTKPINDFPAGIDITFNVLIPAVSWTAAGTAAGIVPYYQVHIARNNNPDVFRTYEIAHSSSTPIFSPQEYSIPAKLGQKKYYVVVDVIRAVTSPNNGRIYKTYIHRQDDELPVFTSRY